MSGCDIKFDDFSLSRRQCNVFWENGQWILTDGDGAKPSTNGTWYFTPHSRLFVEDPFRLEDSTVFKAGQSLFLARVIQGK
jgi:pSer/pThr/pTyr-binding forkhead associated (FHA) protein